MKPRLLDLFCGAGGAAMGYHRAGFDVIGVDIDPQPHYPFEFVQRDVFSFDWATFVTVDAIHASPPCQDHMRGRNFPEHGTGWMLPETRRRLTEDWSGPWVIENVPGATMRPDLKLCGCMFGLPRLKRERWFETSWRAWDMRQPCQHRGRVVQCYGGGGAERGRMADRVLAMGIDWMSRREINQAIPPAYTEYVGWQLREQVFTALGVADV